MYTATIGLEVHAELKTATKMFCGCKNEPHHAEPNQNICPVCLAHPGTLPVPNKEAIMSLVKFGTAVNGQVASYTEFDRKNYFYPDIPKAYQISQYAYPFVTGGTVGGVTLTRVHLEEDTARSQHDREGVSLVDFNRAGVPLLELVTEPVIHSAEEAVSFAQELQLILRTLGISDANMERGEMRVEANISVSDTDQLGTKVEVKNLNSFRSVGLAIEYEINRQTTLLQSGGEVSQETLGWDEQRNQTYTQRSKETAKDYRYFPDPDIPKMDLDKIPEFSAENVSKKQPLLPQDKRLKYGYLGLTSSQIEVIIQNKLTDTYFASLTALPNVNNETLVMSANYLITDVLPLVAVDSIALKPESFYALMSLASGRKIGSRVAKDILIEYIPQNIEVDLVEKLEERGLLHAMSMDQLEEHVRRVISEFPEVAAEYRAGKTASLQYLLGQIMKVTKGSADPVQLRSVLERLLA